MESFQNRNENKGGNMPKHIQKADQELRIGFIQHVDVRCSGLKTRKSNNALTLDRTPYARLEIVNID